MAANLYTPGPIHHFVLFHNNTTPVYLGTAVLAPEPEEEKFKIPVLNDLGGRSVPFQLVQDGETWMVYTTMNRFDYPVIQRIRTLEGGGAPLGAEAGTARGRLVLGVSDWSLILLNEYAAVVAVGGGGIFGGAPAPIPPGLPVTVASAVSGGADLNPGRQWYSCNLRKYKESTQGTRVLEIALAVECQNLFNQTTRGFVCYTEDGTLVNSAALLALVK